MTVVPTTNHIPRFEAGKYGQHAIRIDGSAANLIDSPSGPFGSGNWAKSASMTLAADTTETLDPSGANTADKLTAGANSQTIKYTTGTAKGNEAAGKFWVKSPSGNVSLNLTIETSTVITNAVTATPEWRELKVQGDTSALAAGNLILGLEIVTSGKIVYVWGAALYDSAEFDLGTVGALSTSVKTRGADKLLFASANIINQDKGTIAFWFKPQWAAADHDAATLFNSGQSDAIKHIFIRVLATGFIQLISNKNNSTTLHVDESFDATSLLTQDTWHHYGLTYDATISNGFLQYVDGILRDTSSNDPFNINEVKTNFSLGSDLVGNAPSFCAYDEVIITKDVKPASWFQQIASRTQAVGEGRNYWSSVRLSNLNYARQALRGNRSTIPLEFEEVLT